MKAAITEVRRLVDDLRPPAIDEVGLVGAIRQRAASAVRRPHDRGAPGPDLMPPLPAAVEVAAFRIASEAMTNVARHAGATRCRVDIGVNGSFELTVADNGHGTDRTTDTRGRLDVHAGAGGRARRAAAPSPAAPRVASSCVRSPSARASRSADADVEADA